MRVRGKEEVWLSVDLRLLGLMPDEEDMVTVKETVIMVTGTEVDLGTEVDMGMVVDVGTRMDSITGSAVEAMGHMSHLRDDDIHETIDL